jgi:hypothetical protein
MTGWSTKEATMTDPRLARAFSDLDIAARSAVLDRDALSAAMAAAHRRQVRRRTFASAVGVAALLVAGLLVAPGSHEESLVPAKGGLYPTPATTVVVQPRPTPSGYLASPGPDVLRYWSPYFYAKNPPSDAHPTVTAEQALATDRANSSQGAQPGKTPHEFLALVSLIGINDRVKGYRDRLSWVIEFGGIATDDTLGHTYTSCTAIYIVDATTGAPFHDEVSCPQNRTATPGPS